MAKLQISEKFEPLFEVIRGEHPEVTRVIVTGGRESSKTFTVSVASCIAIVNYNHRILYTRYTLTSAEKSIIPAFNNRVDFIDYSPFVRTRGKSIECLHNNGRIDFAGFKTSSGNQTAALKSLEDYSILIGEEAEEYPSFEDWEKVELSLRAKDVNPFSILVLNPTSTSHWIYKEFFEGRGVKAGHNGIVGDTLYIHVSYLDLGEKYVAPKNWKMFEEARLYYETYMATPTEKRDMLDQKLIKKAIWYNEVVLGGWKNAVDGVIFENWSYFDDWPHYIDDHGNKVYEEYSLQTFGLDWGSVDPTAIIELRHYSNNRTYLKEHMYLPTDDNNLIFDVLTNCLPENVYIIADSAEKKSITWFQNKGIPMIAAQKPPGSIESGIKKLKARELYLHRDSVNLQAEASKYHRIPVSNTRGETKHVVVDKDNHLWDAARYADSLY